MWAPPRVGPEGSRLTVVAGQTPASGDADHSRRKVIGGLRQADGIHVGAQASGAGQLDEGDVVVDGVGVPLGMGEDLGRSRGAGGCESTKHLLTAHWWLSPWQA